MRASLDVNLLQSLPTLCLPNCGAFFKADSPAPPSDRDDFIENRRRLGHGSPFSYSPQSIIWFRTSMLLTLGLERTHQNTLGGKAPDF